MRIGPLRHRVTLQDKSRTQDSSSGEESRTHSNLASIPNVWADVRPNGGGERYVSGAEQQQATITHRVTIRYRTDLTNRMRVVWDSRNLDVESIQDPSGREQYLVLMCREVQP